MQRNILKIALICGMVLFLSATPIHPLNAAETAVDANTQVTDASEELRNAYYVTAQNGLKMRSSPSKDSDVITLLPYGAEVTVIGTSDSGWYEIEYGGDNGYVAAKYVAKSDKTDSGSDNEGVEDDESIPSTDLSSEGMQSSFGATPIITALIAATVIMVILAIFTAYSFLKKDKKYINDTEEEYIDDTGNNEIYDDYDEDGDYDYDEDNNNYIEDEYYDGNEYYSDEEYYDEDE